MVWEKRGAILLPRQDGEAKQQFRIYLEGFGEKYEIQNGKVIGIISD